MTFHIYQAGIYECRLPSPIAGQEPRCRYFHIMACHYTSELHYAECRCGLDDYDMRFCLLPEHFILAVIEVPIAGQR